MEHRLFVSQDTLDQWLSEERVSVDGDVLTLPDEGRGFRLASAVHFVTEVTEAGDPAGLIGRVKDLEELAQMGGEHYADSVLLGEVAYEVVEGFVGSPVPSAASAQPGDDVELLARFFLDGRGSGDA